MRDGSWAAQLACRQMNPWVWSSKTASTRRYSGRLIPMLSSSRLVSSEGVARDEPDVGIGAATDGKELIGSSAPCAGDPVEDRREDAEAEAARARMDEEPRASFNLCAGPCTH